MTKKNDIISKTIRLQDKIKHHLFEKKIKKKEKNFKRKYEREMDEEEITSYKFSLFMVYSFILVVPLIFMFSL